MIKRTNAYPHDILPQALWRQALPGKDVLGETGVVYSHFNPVS